MKRKDFALKIVLAVCVCIALIGNNGYTYTEATSVNSSTQKNNAVISKTEIDKKIKELEKELSNLNDEMQKISNNLNSIDKELNEKQAQVDETTKALMEAKEKEESQYAAMKKRIKHIYEKGSTSYLEAIFGAESFGEFVSRMEYVSMISEYDQNMLAEYRSVRAEAQEENEKLEAEEKELTDLKEKTLEEQKKAGKLINEVSKKINNYSKQSDEIAAAIKKYEEKLKANESAGSQSGNSSGKVYYSTNTQPPPLTEPLPEVTGVDSAENATDLQLLSAIIECEAGAEGYEEMLGVGSVVMNRIRSTKYPNTMLEVLYQYKQFSPVGSGRFAVVLARGAMPKCVQAAVQTLGGYTNVGDCIGFKLASTGIQGIVIGKIVFFK